MSIGVFLDRAARALASGEARMQAATTPGAYDAAATLTARDELYRQLGRFVALAVGRDHEQQSPQVMNDFVALLGGDAGRPFAREVLLSLGIEMATLGLSRTNPDLLRAPGTAAGALMDAADGVAFAAEIVATHRNLRPGRIPWGQRAGPRYLTRESHAIADGAQRRETIAEVARLLLPAMRIDSRLYSWRELFPDALTAQQWHDLGQWVNCSFPEALTEMAAGGQAKLLRQLGPAPTGQRPAGVSVQSWEETITLVQAARSALRRYDDNGTVALAGAAARLGFAVTAVAWRLAGRGAPDDRTLLHGQRWRDLSKAVQSVADIRDDLSYPYAAAMGQARNWIKRTFADRSAHVAPAEFEQILRLEREIRRLCRDLSESIREAITASKLMTATFTLDKQPSSGVFLAVAVWSPPSRNDPAISALQKALLRIERLIDERQPQPGNESRSLPARSSSAATTVDPALVGSAFPQPAGVVPSRSKPTARPFHTSQDQRSTQRDR
jgi:hypothetical protein